MRAGEPGVRRRNTVGWCLAVVSIVLSATVPLSFAGDVASRSGVEPGVHATLLLPSVVVVGFVVAGMALVHLRPSNLLGWLLLVTGLLHAVSDAASSYGVRALTDPDQSLMFGLFATWIGSCAAVPALLLPALVMPALYPTGQAPSRFWTWHIRVSLAGTALMLLAVATVNAVTNEAVAGTRLPWDAPHWWAWATAGTGAALLIPSVGVVLIGTLVRVARARSPERQQLLWLICVVGVMVATLALPASEVPFTVALACIPLAVVVGVLRYRLLGIEVVLRRTLLYVPLTLLVALAVGGLTTVLARLVPEGPLPLGRLGRGGRPGLPGVGPAPAVGRPAVLGERADPAGAGGPRRRRSRDSQRGPVAAMLDAVALPTGASYAAVRDAARAGLATVGALCRRGTFERAAAA